jgi:L-tryptophan--pyruvate aminotransferase
LVEAEDMVAWESCWMAAVCCVGRIGVVASVVVNLAWFAMLIFWHYFGGNSRSDGNNGGGGEVTMVEPSKGNPPVTSDSIVNLHQ